MRRSQAILAAVLLAALSPQLALADAPPPGPTVVNLGFSAVERETIRQYFLKHPEQLQGADSSVAIVPGRPLPPGALQQARPLPQELERALPPVHQGYERVILAGKVLLVERGAQVVHDAI
jgi:hypothetical protein